MNLSKRLKAEKYVNEAENADDKITFQIQKAIENIEDAIGVLNKPLNKLYELKRKTKNQEKVKSALEDITFLLDEADVEKFTEAAYDAASEAYEINEKRYV